MAADGDLRVPALKQLFGEGFDLDSRWTTENCPNSRRRIKQL
jgi:hypothetical protein